MTAMGPQMGKIKMPKTKDTIIVIREEEKKRQYHDILIGYLE